MHAAMAEFPLAVFTACSLVGAGAFTAQALALAFSGGQARPSERRIDMESLVPTLVIVVGFCAAFAHLASPLNAPFALLGVGHSPLSNEVIVGAAFLAACAVYCLLVSLGRIGEVPRRIYAVALGVGGLAFALATGAAYLTGTVLSWDMPYTLIETLGLSVFAGGCLFAFLDRALPDEGPALSRRSRVALSLAVVVGAIVGFGALSVHVAAVADFETALLSGAALADGAVGLLVLALLGGAVGAVCSVLALLRPLLPGWVAGAGALFALAAVFAARLAFYALQMPVAL